MSNTPNPSQVARIVAFREQGERNNAKLDKMHQRRGGGYRGPLTRDDAARLAAERFAS